MLRLVSLLLVLGLSACEKRNAEAYGPRWPNTVVGTLTQEEVEIIASKIGMLRFPASKEDLMAFLPHDLTPDNVAGYEMMLHGADDAGAKWWSRRGLLAEPKLFRPRRDRLL